MRPIDLTCTASFRRCLGIDDGKPFGLNQVDKRTIISQRIYTYRELVSLLHQQMQVADTATAELERARARSWWRRLRG